VRSEVIIIKATNSSDTAVRIIGSMYVLSGTTLAANDTPGPVLDPEKLTPAIGTDFGPSARYSATTTQANPTLIQFGQVVADQMTLVPDESTEISVVAFFPAERYDLLRLGTEIAIARDDRLATGEPTRVADADLSPAPDEGEHTASSRPLPECAGRRTVAHVWPVQHSSMVEILTRERTEVVLGKVVEGNPEEDDPAWWWPPQPYLVYQIQPTGQSCGHLFDSYDDGLEIDRMADMTGALTERLVPVELAVRPGG
jgi:hypothetical protein